ncbi:S8 family peptidase [Sphingomonas montana]|uniref:S8 family peptidase n=1 Tax=Sphingomonas montana TaxID=1843236 RepID=UPI00096D6698|nr:S8 family peptidase [Sphingomonas montana]
MVLKASARHATILLLLATTACGGATGSGTVSSTPTPPPATPTPTPTPTPPPVTQPDPITPTPTPPATGTGEYQRSAGAVQASAGTAHDRGITGTGVVAGVIGSGIDPDSAEFAGRISAASLDLVGARGIRDEDGHGTAVAGVLGAARNDIGALGIAYGATLLVLRTDTAGSCATADGCSHNDSAIARGIDVAVQNRARVINISLGGTESGGAAFRAAVNRATAAGVVIVLSAGNDPTPDPDAFALIANGSEARGLVVIAGASGQDGQIASFSARAGSGSAHYLLALGERVRSVDEAGGTFLYSGTSFSAPLISGAVALLAQAFPNLSGQQIVDILYATATDLGAGGVDAVNGRGRLNLASAFRPIGATALAGSGMAVAMTDNATLSAAMGDAGRSGASAGAVMLDGYGRAFTIDLARTLAHTAPEGRLYPALAGGVRQVSGGVPGAMFAVTIASRGGDVAVERLTLARNDAAAARATAGMVATRIGVGMTMGLGFAQGAASVARAMTGQGGTPFLVAGDPREAAGFRQRTGSSLAVRRDQGGLGVTVTAESGDALVLGQRTGTRRVGRYDRQGYATVGVAIDRWFGPLLFGMGVSRLTERATVLGGRFTAPLGAGGAVSDFVDLSARAAPGGGWTLAGVWRQGWTRGAAGSVALNGARLRTGAWSVEIGKAGLFGGTDRAGLRVAQPLRVARGGVDLTLPVGYDYATGAVEMGVRRLGLAPNGRELDVEGSFGRAALGGWMSTNLYWRRDPGNFADGPADVGGAVRFSVAL